MPSHYHSWSTDFADKVEDTGRKGIEKLKEWSKEDDTTWTDDALRAGGSALKIAGHAANLPVAKQALKILGAGGWAGGKVGGKIAESLKIDPRLGRWTGGAIGDAVSGGLIAKGAKISRATRALQKLDPVTAGNILKKGPGASAVHISKGNLRDTLKVASKSGKVQKELIQAGKSLKIDKLPDVVKDVQIARKLKGESQFVSEIAEKTTRMKNLISKTADKRGHANLSKYKGGDNLITTPTGEKFKYMWKDGRYSWRSMTSEAKRALTRLTGESADLTTITDQYKKYFNPKQAKEAAQIYVGTQQTVKKKIDNAIKQFNAGKVKKDPSRLSLEHITDVKFLDRIKKDVPGFAGKGANELQNLTILDLPTNMRTGALNKKLDHWQSVIDSVKTGKGFPDYNKAIANFIYEDVGGMVADFKPKDWDNFIDQMITRPGDTAYDILIEMARKRN